MSFDQNKANFLLVASVVGWLLLMCALYLGTCIYGHSMCTNDGRVIDFINGLLASVFAYVAGKTSGTNGE